MTVLLNTVLRRLLPPNVIPKTHKYWQADYSLPLPGSDCWPWWTCHVCPWPRMHGTFTASCSLLWCQRSAILQAKSSKRTCRWSSYPRQPRAAASHDPLLFNGWVDLQWTRGWPLWTIWEFFLFLSVLNGYEYDNIRSCRKVLIILFGVMLSSVIIFDSAAPSWPWISRWAWQGQTVRDTRFIHCIYLSKY